MPFAKLAVEFSRLGWEAQFVSLAEAISPAPRDLHARVHYFRALLDSRSSDFDVIDFDHAHLPFPRSRFPRRLLLVARSVCLVRQVASLSYPQPRSLRRAVGASLRDRSRRRAIDDILASATTTVEQADLVNVSNRDDARLLMGGGVPAEKVVVLPYGLDASHAARLGALQPDRDHEHVVAFIGRFTWPKGAADIPAVVGAVTQRIPDARFRLLGTNGMFHGRAAVLKTFPARVRSRVEVVPAFSPEELPALLEDCALGFFPSYYDAFGLGVLEMLAASLPVIAYRVGGPATLLDQSGLVLPGDVDALSGRIVRLLEQPDALRQARIDARTKASHFQWDAIAMQTERIYARHLSRIDH